MALWPRLTTGRAVLEIGQVPAAPDDPVVVRMRLGIGSDLGQNGLATARLAHVALHPIDASRDRVGMGVLKPRDQQPTIEIDDSRPRSDVAGDLGRRPHGDNAFVADGHRLGSRPR